MLDLPFGEVVAGMASDNASLLRGALEKAPMDSRSLVAALVPSGSWPTLVPDGIQIEIAPLRTHTRRVVLSFAWVSADEHALFSWLDADLEGFPLGQHHTLLAVRGYLRTPREEAEQQIDHPQSQGLAEVTIRMLLMAICGALAGALDWPKEGSHPVG